MKPFLLIRMCHLKTCLHVARVPRADSMYISTRLHLDIDFQMGPMHARPVRTTEPGHSISYKSEIFSDFIMELYAVCTH